MPEPDYECAKCHDTEVITWHDEQHRPWARKCGCAARREEMRRQESYRALCNLPANTGHMTLANFRAQTPDLARALAAATALADDTGGVHWLTLLGGCDRGKTHLGIAICRRRLDRGHLARYAFTSLLLDELRQGYAKEGDSSYEAMFNFFCRVELLVLDDLGVENPTAWVQEKLETIVDYRAVNGLPLVITTNLPMTRLPLRIASRIKRESGSVILGIEAPEFRTVRNGAAGNGVRA